MAQQFNHITTSKLTRDAESRQQYEVDVQEREVCEICAYLKKTDKNKIKYFNRWPRKFRHDVGFVPYEHRS